MLIAIAGHIDHGKTSLVRALTGVDTDRLPEEKKRGISVDIGFAYWADTEGGVIGFIDVPGHERFVRNMLAGVTAVDFALLIIAADDGIMPQTLEHQQILDLLGVEHGFVVITKCDRVDAERLSIVRTQASALLDTGRLKEPRIFEVSSATGSGIDELKHALRLYDSSFQKEVRRYRHLRFSIDRAFSITGSGTIVTGTVLDGSLEAGIRLTLSPSGIETRIRGLHAAGKSISRAKAGERCAINLAGIEVNRIRRGHWLVEAGHEQTTSRIEVVLSALKGRSDPIKHNSRIHLHIGAADIEGRILIPSQGLIEPGKEAIVQIVLGEKIHAVNGDRFVIRDQAGRETIGGGRILDPFATNRRNNARRQMISAALSHFDPKVSLDALIQIPNLEIDAKWFTSCFNLTEAGFKAIYSEGNAIVLPAKSPLIMSRNRVEQARGDILAQLDTFHKAQPSVAGMPSRLIETKLKQHFSVHTVQALIHYFIAERIIESGGSFIKRVGFTPIIDKTEAQLWGKITDAVTHRGLRPFTASEIAHDLNVHDRVVNNLLNRRKTEPIDVFKMTEDRYFLRSQLLRLVAIADDLAQAQPNGFSAAHYRDASGLGRNIVIHILEYFDRLGITQRLDDLRRMRQNFQNVLGD